MSRLGWYLFLFGAGSAVLAFLDREFVILGWIESWGTGVAWAIRAALVLIGVVLMAATAQNADPNAAATDGAT